jgi:hypothetical protein
MCNMAMEVAGVVSQAPKRVEQLANWEAACATCASPHADAIQLLSKGSVVRLAVILDI